VETKVQNQEYVSQEMVLQDWRILGKINPIVPR